MTEEKDLKMKDKKPEKKEAKAPEEGKTPQKDKKAPKKDAKKQKGNEGAKRGRDSGDRQGKDGKDQEFQERVVTINRVTKVVKGGRRFSFSALVVTGDNKGRVGFGSGKAVEIPEAISKAARFGKKYLQNLPLKDHRTIPHEVVGKFGSSRVIMIPAGPGTGVIAGGPVRAVLEAAGIKDILTKCVGSKNAHNVVRATFQGLSQLKGRRG